MSGLGVAADWRIASLIGKKKIMEGVRKTLDCVKKETNVLC